MEFLVIRLCAFSHPMSSIDPELQPIRNQFADLDCFVEPIPCVVRSHPTNGVELSLFERRVHDLRRVVALARDCLQSTDEISFRILVRVSWQLLHDPPVQLWARKPAGDNDCKSSSAIFQRHVVAQRIRQQRASVCHLPIHFLARDFLILGGFGHPLAGQLLPHDLPLSATLTAQQSSGLIVLQKFEVRALISLCVPLFGQTILWSSNRRCPLETNPSSPAPRAELSETCCGSSCRGDAPYQRSWHCDYVGTMYLNARFSPRQSKTLPEFSINFSDYDAASTS